MKIELNNNEILVLYELLNRINEKEDYFEDTSEQMVLWKIEAQLDKKLLEPFMSNYSQLVEQARKSVREKF